MLALVSSSISAPLRRNCRVEALRQSEERPAPANASNIIAVVAADGSIWLHKSIRWDLGYEPEDL